MKYDDWEVAQGISPGSPEAYYAEKAWSAAREVEWFTTAPKEPGFYWLNEGQAVGTKLVQVEPRPGHGYLCIEEEPSGLMQKPSFRAVEKMRGARWAGPIQLPVPNYCKCVDCGGTEASHSPDCTYMKELHG